MRAPLVGVLLALAGCAHTPPPAAPAVCPTVATSWTPRPWPPLFQHRPKYPCMRPTPTPGAEALPHGRDLDEALFCVERYYTGPDGLPIDAMLKGALDALVREYPRARRIAVSTVLDEVDTVQSLTHTLLRVAALTRATIGNPYARAPEDVLLAGALSALAWDTELRRPPFVSADDPPPAESYTGVARDDLVYVKVGLMSAGMAQRFRSELSWRPVRGAILDLRGSQGGLFREATALADLFARTGCLCASRPHPDAAAIVAHDQPADIDAPLVILVDQRTAEGAELVAATLRARGRAVLVGTHTLGRALLHTIIQLSSGARLKVCLGELLAGDGTPFHQTGVEPDVALPASFEPGNAEREIDFAKRLLRSTRSARREDLLATARQIAAAAPAR